MPDSLFFNHLFALPRYHGDLPVQGNLIGGFLEVGQFLDRDGSSAYVSGKIEKTSDWRFASNIRKMTRGKRRNKHYSPFEGSGAQEVMS